MIPNPASLNPCSFLFSLRTEYIGTGEQRLFINVTGSLVHKRLYLSIEQQMFAEELEQLQAEEIRICWQDN